MKPNSSERGSFLALGAVFMLVVVLALLILLDGMRLYRVRNLLQVATDAACQDAAVSAPDYEHYKETGETRFLPGVGEAKAWDTFRYVLAPDGAPVLGMQSPALTVTPEDAADNVLCEGSVDVPMILGPETHILTATSISAIRFSSP